MNTNEVSPKANQQMKRIRLMSQIIKVLLLVFVFSSGLIALLIKSNGSPYRVFGMPFASYSDIPAVLKIMSAIAIGIYLLAVVFFYRLLNLYERGTVFSLANVRIYKMLGFLVVGHGLLTAYAPAAARPDLDIFRRLVILLFETTSSNWIIGGLFVVMISLIMQEACKLREEQELTV